MSFGSAYLILLQKRLVPNQESGDLSTRLSARLKYYICKAENYLGMSGGEFFICLQDMQESRNAHKKE